MSKRSYAGTSSKSKDPKVFKKKKDIFLGKDEVHQKPRSKSHMMGGNPFRNTNKGVYLVKKSLNYEDRFQEEDVEHFDLVQNLLIHNPVKSTIHRSVYDKVPDPEDDDDQRKEAKRLINEWMKKESDLEQVEFDKWFRQYQSELEYQYTSLKNEVSDFDYIINDDIDDQLLESINEMNDRYCELNDIYYDRIEVKLDEIKKHDVDVDLLLNFSLDNNDIDELFSEYPLLEKMIEFYKDADNFKIKYNFESCYFAFMASNSGKTFLSEQYCSFFYDVDNLLDWDGGHKKLEFLIKYSREKDDWSVTNNYWKELISKYHYVYRRKVLLCLGPQQIPEAMLERGKSVVVFMGDKIRKTKLQLDNEKALHQLSDNEYKKVTIVRSSYLFFFISYFSLLENNGSYFKKKKWSNSEFKGYIKKFSIYDKYFFVK